MQSIDLAIAEVNGRECFLMVPRIAPVEVARTVYRPLVLMPRGVANTVIPATSYCVAMEQETRATHKLPRGESQARRLRIIYGPRVLAYPTFAQPITGKLRNAVRLARAKAARA